MKAFISLSCLLRACILMAIGLFIMPIASSFAAVPQLINYQGKLTKATGAPLDTTISMVFTIFADSNGTTSKWSESQSSVKVEKAVFNVLLGSMNAIPDSVFDGTIRYLGVKVGSDPEITPKKAMVSVPYAYTDGDWTQSGDDIYRSKGNVIIGTTEPSNIQLYVDGNIVCFDTTSFGLLGYGSSTGFGIGGSSTGSVGYWPGTGVAGEGDSCGAAFLSTPGSWNYYCVYAHNNSGATAPGLFVHGYLTVSGTKSSLVETSHGSEPLFAIESPDVEFMTSGSGKLISGETQVVFERLFRESISSDAPVKIILTPRGPVGGILYVNNESSSGFTVKLLPIPGLEAYAKNVSFYWAAIGMRKGYEVRPNIVVPKEEQKRITR
jgi:hypothetical protein